MFYGIDFMKPYPYVPVCYRKGELDFWCSHWPTIHGDRFPCQLLSCELSVSRTILHWGREGPKRLASHCWWFRNPTFRTSLDKALWTGAKCRTSETSRGPKSSQGGPTVMFEDGEAFIFGTSSSNTQKLPVIRFVRTGCLTVSVVAVLLTPVVFASQFSTRKKEMIE